MTAPIKPWQKGASISPISSTSTAVSESSPQSVSYGYPSDPVLPMQASSYPFGMTSNVNFGGGYPGNMPYGGMGGMYPGMYPGFGGDQLWTGVLGQAAESLGRLNNLLSMTGMLVEHVSSHTKLLYVKAQELYIFSLTCRRYCEKNKAEIYSQLGLEIDQNPQRSLEERQRELFFRRFRSGGVLILLAAVSIAISRKLKNRPKFEAAFSDAFS